MKPGDLVLVDLVTRMRPAIVLTSPSPGHLPGTMIGDVYHVLEVLLGANRETITTDDIIGTLSEI